MIAYIKGEITFKHQDFILVEASGIGYKVHISWHTYGQIEKLEKVKILTYLNIKEDSHTLYGFAEDAERSLFIHLISVSGIGPNTARILLSGMSTDEARAAIIGENVNAFKKIKGIGPKTAKRIILDLKDKLLKESGGAPLSISVADNTIRDEALSALVALGFPKIRVQKVLNKLLREGKYDTVQTLIKQGLNNLR